MGTQIIAISTDDVDTLKRFKASLQAPYPFVSDAQGKLMAAYGIKTSYVVYKQRTTFVIDTHQRITRIDYDKEAIDPGKALGAAQACQIPKP